MCLLQLNAAASLLLYKPMVDPKVGSGCPQRCASAPARPSCSRWHVLWVAAVDDYQAEGLTAVCLLQLNAAASLLMYKPRKPMKPMDTNKVDF